MFKSCDHILPCMCFHTNNSCKLAVLDLVAKFIRQWVSLLWAYDMSVLVYTIQHICVQISHPVALWVKKDPLHPRHRVYHCFLSISFWFIFNQLSGVLAPPIFSWFISFSSFGKIIRPHSCLLPPLLNPLLRGSELSWHGCALYRDCGVVKQQFSNYKCSPKKSTKTRKYQNIIL